MEIKEIKEQLKDMFRTVLNDKWITIHPHGEDSDDYRRLKLEDGETPKEAIDRVYKKEDKSDTKDGKEERIEARRKHQEVVKKHNQAYKDFEDGKISMEELEKADKELEKSNKEFYGQPDTKDGGEYSEDFKKLADETVELERNYLENPSSELAKQINKNRNKLLSNKKYAKLVYDKNIAKPDTKDKESDSKDEKKDTLKDNNSIEQFLTDKSDSGFLYKSKGTNTYTNGYKKAEVEEFGDEGGKYRVVFYDGNKRKDIKAYSTKRGMEKAVREHLSGEANKETKALETKTDLNAAEAKYKEVLQRYNENNRKRWSSGLSSAEYYKAYDEAEKAKKELTTARREYAESIMANFEKSDNTYYEDKQNARRERYEELSEKAQKSSDSYAKTGKEMFDVIPFGQPIHGQRDRNYRDNAWGKFEKSWEEQEKANYYADKAASVGKAGISADDANAIAKLAQKYKSGVTSAEKRRIIDRVIDIHKNRQMAGDTSKQTDYSDLGFQVERNTDINRLQLKFDGKPEANVRSILKSNGFRWSPREGAWQRQLGGNSEGGLNRVIEQLKNVNNSLLEGLDEILSNDNLTPEEMTIINCINNILDPTVDNDKETEMALIEELKKLITKVENTKGDKDMEIENAKVDKRKLIDEVAGIMKSAGCDDEDIRTAIGKMEKIGYDDSEKSADNEKEKEKAENCGKKVKNEEEKDEKEVEEAKEEIKEDVDNKCKNSKEDYFEKLNEIYNAASQAKEEVEYTSRADREKAAEDYFAK